jgi:hypothetical protein
MPPGPEPWTAAQHDESTPQKQALGLYWPVAHGSFQIFYGWFSAEPPALTCFRNQETGHL